MAALRAAINLTCPTCGNQLPTLPILSTVGRLSTMGNSWEVRLSADPDQQWWDEVNRDHLECVIL